MMISITGMFSSALAASPTALAKCVPPILKQIQVLEMYSSGGDLHLELPEGGLEADDSLWQIPPYHTKPVMKATFLARAESNHTAYIRYKEEWRQWREK